MRGFERWRSFVAAAVLLCVTLFTFFALQDYGPESAVRRFHSDLMEQNLNDLQVVALQNIQGRDLGILVNQIRPYLTQGSAFPRIARTERTPSRVNVLVLYPTSFGVQPIVWVVVKEGRLWKVDVAQTWRGILNLRGQVLPEHTP